MGKVNKNLATAWTLGFCLVFFYLVHKIILTYSIDKVLIIILYSSLLLIFCLLVLNFKFDILVTYICKYLIVVLYGLIIIFCFIMAYLFGSVSGFKISDFHIVKLYLFNGGNKWDYFWVIKIAAAIFLSTVVTTFIVVVLIIIINCILKKIKALSHIKLSIILKITYNFIVYFFSLITFVMSFVPLFLGFQPKKSIEMLYIIICLFIALSHKQFYDLFKKNQWFKKILKI